MHPADSHYDIIFLGGGLASNLIARFLQKKNPDRKILVLEKILRPIIIPVNQQWESLVYS